MRDDYDNIIKIGLLLEREKEWLKSRTKIDRKTLNMFMKTCFSHEISHQRKQKVSFGG